MYALQFSSLLKIVTDLAQNRPVEGRMASLNLAYLGSGYAQKLGSDLKLVMRQSETSLASLHYPY